MVSGAIFVGGRTATETPTPVPTVARPTGSAGASPAAHGALLYEAKFDASGSDFRFVAAFVGSSPDPSAGQLVAHEGSLDLVVTTTAPHGNLGVLTVRSLPARYLAELDVALHPKAPAFTFVWRVAFTTAGDTVITADPETETLRLRFTGASGQTNLTEPVTARGLLSGRTVRLGFMRDGARFAVLVDGVTVAQGSDARLGNEVGQFLFRVVEQGSVTLSRLRVYSVD